jgi:hypothetical protein
MTGRPDWHHGEIVVVPDRGSSAREISHPDWRGGVQTCDDVRAGHGPPQSVAAQNIEHVADGMLANLWPADAMQLETSFGGSPESARATIINFLSVPGGGFARPASADEISAFKSTDEGKTLAAEWRAHTARNLGRVRQRAKLILDKISEDNEEAV